MFESTNEEEAVEISKTFKVLDKLVLPINDPFWDMYLPPNYLGDNCQVKVSDKEVTTIPPNLPLVDRRFQINRHETFYSKELFNRKANHSTTQNPTSLETIAIDVNKLVYEAFEEVYGEKRVKFLDDRLKKV